MDSRVIVIGAVVLLLLVVLMVYFSMAEPADASTNGDWDVGVPVVTSVVTNGAGGGSVTVSWSGEEKPSGYIGNTASGYPKNMTLAECKLAAAGLPATVGLTYNTTRSQCYPKMVMDPSKRKRYSDVVGYRKL